MARQTTITIETESVLILRGRSEQSAWCPGCGAEAEVIALEKVGVISNLNTAEVQQWLNCGQLHCSHSPDGSTLVCLKSLLMSVKVPKSR